MKESILERNKENVIDLFKDNGAPYIADYYGVSNSLVYKKLYEWGVRDSPTSIDFDKHKDKIIEWKFQDGLTNDQIANKLNEDLDTEYIKDWLTLSYNRWGLDTTCYKMKSYFYKLEQNKEDVIRMLRNYANYRDIADKFNVSLRSVSTKANEWNISKWDKYTQMYYELDNPEEELGVYHDRFYCFHIKNMSQKEVAEYLDRKLNSVKTGIYRARNILDSGNWHGYEKAWEKYYK